MVIFASVLFVASLCGIAILFGLKAFEERQGRVIAPALRGEADRKSLNLKANLAESRAHLSKVPPLLNRLGWLLIHEAALGFATLARLIERQAHKLADFVSQKHRFERRTTRSQFLKSVSEHKNHNGKTSIRDEKENI